MKEDNLLHKIKDDFIYWFFVISSFNKYIKCLVWLKFCLENIVEHKHVQSRNVLNLRYISCYILDDS